MKVKERNFVHTHRHRKNKDEGPGHTLGLSRITVTTNLTPVPSGCSRLRPLPPSRQLTEQGTDPKTSDPSPLVGSKVRSIPKYRDSFYTTHFMELKVKGPFFRAKLTEFAFSRDTQVNYLLRFSPKSFRWPPRGTETGGRITEVRFLGPPSFSQQCWNWDVGVEVQVMGSHSLDKVTVSGQSSPEIGTITIRWREVVTQGLFLRDYTVGSGTPRAGVIPSSSCSTRESSFTPISSFSQRFIVCGWYRPVMSQRLYIKLHTSVTSMKFLVCVVKLNKENHYVINLSLYEK